MACIPTTQRNIRYLTIVFMLIIQVSMGLVQSSDIISANTIDQLKSRQQIDYSDFDININIGWFVTNDTATEFIVFDNQKTLHRIADGEIVESWQYVTDSEQVFSVIDGAYWLDEFYILYTIDNQYWINENSIVVDGIPLALGTDGEFLYVEAQVDTDLVVYQLDDTLAIIDEMIIPSDNDEPVIRVGRIDLPTILQTTFDGAVSLFDFDQLIGEFQVEDVPTVFGHVNASQTHFAWSDPNSTSLNLLDLTTGDNVEIADLNNLYSQYYLLSHDASLVIAVNVDFEPIAVAWDTTTGERYELGEYRACERIPDKMTLSADGTTLVIGCDMGLDLWRVIDETETE